MKLKDIGKAITGGISKAWNGLTGFLGRHKYAIGVTLLSLIGGAALTAALVFFFPATIATIIGFAAALPFVGAPVAAFLSSLGLVGAAAVIGGAATAVGLAGSTVAYGVAQLFRFIGNVVIGAYKGARNEVLGAPAALATEDRLNTAETNLGNAVDAARDLVNGHVDTKSEQIARHVTTKVTETRDALNRNITATEDHLKAKLKKARNEVSETKDEVRALEGKIDTLSNMVSALLRPQQPSYDVQEQEKGRNTRNSKYVRSSREEEPSNDYFDELADFSGTPAPSALPLPVSQPSGVGRGSSFFVAPTSNTTNTTTTPTETQSTFGSSIS
ncbi:MULTISPECIES: hypothetical protein [Legionella]|uniref:Transmembrane protein n=1 Tax=Legionella drozanskii LLAP-1 TaxID=1212489 RepID=A0A0W0SXM6_9GAMM|nr:MULTISPECIES: hypothetical protein [Legionella]KTC88102.1 hypothetical protein Ldro_1721 [Legionella drozanskii LLAP-1]PJE08145.1 MAG: hypothetical protein CK430_12925 [Legionella sp.]